MKPDIFAKSTALESAEELSRLRFRDPDGEGFVDVGMVSEIPTSSSSGDHLHRFHDPEHRGDEAIAASGGCFDPGLIVRTPAPQAKPANPKQAFGDKKPPLGYLPMSAKLACMEALYDGMLKYGPHNWRDINVEAMTYVEAAMRHLELYKVGEEITRDTLVKNLGAVMACCTILIDAAAHGTLIDNRRHSKIEADLLHASEEWVARLKAVQQERDSAKGK